MRKNVVKKSLPNGLKLLMQPMEMLESVSVGLQINVGSRDESDQQAGLSHLIEHMLFQGTGKRNMRELSRVIAAVGGQLDACTGRESTVLYAKVPADHIELAIDVIADMVFDPLMQSGALMKEKSVILEEINMVDDTPDELVHDTFYQVLWPGHPLGRSILGSKESLESISKKSIREFMKQYYTPSNMILAIAGKFSVARTAKLVNKYFGTKEKKAKESVIVMFNQEECSSVWKKRDLEQVHICMGVKTFPYDDSRRLAAVALSNILGGGANSRLFYEVREKHALSYSVYSFVDFYRDTGLLGVYAACHADKLEKTIYLIKKQIDLLVKKGVTSQELRDVKEQLKGNLKLSLESSSSHMWSMLQHETYLKYHPATEKIISAIELLSLADIKNISVQLFQGKKFAEVVLGPFSGKNRINFR